MSKEDKSTNGDISSLFIYIITKIKNKNVMSTCPDGMGKEPLRWEGEGGAGPSVLLLNYFNKSLYYFDKRHTDTEHCIVKKINYLAHH